MKSIFVSLMVLGSLLTASKGLTEQIFRYKDNSGGVILNSILPPEYASRGYSVLNEQGDVISIVPPALQVGERQQQHSRQAQEKKARHLQEQNDAVLLQLYSSPEDVLRAMQREEGQFDFYLEQQHIKIAELQRQKKRLAQQASEFERSGQTVPDNLIREFNRLDNNIASARQDIQRKKKQRERQRMIFQKDHDRLVYLLKKS